MAIRILTRQPDGRVSARDVAAAAVAIGSSPHGTVVLGGGRVGALHLLLERGRDGVWKAQAQAPFAFTLDQRPGLAEARLAPGQTIALGPHEIAILSPVEGCELVLEVRPDARRDARIGALTLAEAGLRLRRPAWLLAIGVLLLALVIPWLMAGLPPEAAPRAVLPTDTLWSSGRISNAHQHLAGDCRSCHVSFFVRVRDETCRSCHEGLGTHSAEPAILHASGLEERRCSSCHKEHGSPHAIVPAHPGLCGDCHARPHRNEWSAHLPPAADFGRAHPPFRARVVAALAEGRPMFERVPLHEGPRDDSGLIYPHDLHLKAGLEGPDGPETLVCADCHRPGPGRVGFQPIVYEAHCQRCHALTVEEAEPPLRLPHGDLAAARWMLAQLAPTVIAAEAEAAGEERRRAGLSADRGEPLTPAAWMESQIESRLCAKCHAVPVPGEGLAPVHLAQSWWPAARFTHAPHQASDCALCHSATESGDAQELLLPDIATCRTCHSGVASSQGIRSTCVDCHGFHQVPADVVGKVLGALADAAARGQP